MEAAVWHAAGNVQVESVAEPDQPRPGHVVVEVTLACICASDVAEYRNGPHVIPTRRPHPISGRMAPLTLGHEYTGRVLAVASDVDNVVRGDRVCGDACLRCRKCFWCLRGEYNLCPIGGSIGLHADGAFAPLVEVPAYTLYKVPDRVGDREAAVVEPLAVGLHALRRARFNAGESVVIFGYGMIGASAASVAIATGAASVQVVEPTSQRRELALEMGVAEAYDPQRTDVRAEVRLRTSSRGADVVVDSTGNPEVLRSAVEASRRGGRVVLVGIGHNAAQIEPDRLVYFEREVVGSLGYQFDHPAVLALLATGRLRVDRFFGEVIGLADIVGAGLQRTMEDRASPLRIPVNPVP